MVPPKKKTWKRARKPEQKAERIDAILEAAGVLLEENGLEGTGLNAIAQAFAESLARRRRFCTLSASLASVFEHNVGPETVAQFKREFLAIVQPCISALSEALPELSDEESSRALAMLVMSATGMWAHCHPSPSVEVVLKQPEFENIKFDFRETISRLAACFLGGLLSRS